MQPQGEKLAIKPVLLKAANINKIINLDSSLKSKLVYEKLGQNIFQGLKLDGFFPGDGISAGLIETSSEESLKPNKLLLQNRLQ